MQWTRFVSVMRPSPVQPGKSSGRYGIASSSCQIRTHGVAVSRGIVTCKIRRHTRSLFSVNSYSFHGVRFLISDLHFGNLLPITATSSSSSSWCLFLSLVASRLSICDISERQSGNGDRVIISSFARAFDPMGGLSKTFVTYLSLSCLAQYGLVRANL